MENETPTTPAPRATIVRGAEDQAAALERLWASQAQTDPVADEVAWQILRRALNDARRAAGERILYPDE